MGKRQIRVGGEIPVLERRMILALRGLMRGR